jgi:RimJ/RimL family protein N-acetyltransferase
MLQGKVVGLRAIEREDLPQLLAWRNRPEFRRYFREHRELSREQQLNWFENTVLRDASTRMFAIVDLADSRLLGACGLCYINWVDRNADFSIYIGDEHVYIDHHYAPDAAHVMIDYGFGELALHRLWAEIYDFDDAKKEFFERLGFTLDGRHRETHWSEGGWHDSLFFSLLAGDMRSHNK